MICRSHSIEIVTYDDAFWQIVNNRIEERAENLGRESDMVSKAVHREELFKCSCNQVLILVTCNDGVAAGVNQSIIEGLTHLSMSTTTITLR